MTRPERGSAARWHETPGVLLRETQMWNGHPVLFEDLESSA